MPMMNFSPPPDASSTVRGLVNLAAQSFTGIKTFVSTLVASIGITANAATLNLRSDLGAAVSDIAVKIGSTVADASTSQAAKLVSARTGLGGSEVEQFSVTTKGVIHCSSTLGYFDSNNSVGITMNWNNVSVVTADSNRVTVIGVTDVTLKSNAADGASAVGVAINTNITWANAAAKLLSLRNNGTENLAVLATGRLDQSGTDSSGSPGAQTVNKPTGKNAIALGASAVVITNSLVAVGSRVMITPHARDATCKELIAVAAAGSFTVSGTANATAALPFSWEVSNLL